ncbi:hypothetical protein [uncultured Bacteroides sp.]|uniref:hypothetical protein n=1 Tax=uncultured Bacteroides sp. TaxID=162156 RepID=UPI002AABD887|nr:hypothetical protein [uncultured Bacteroides sp.]
MKLFPKLRKSKEEQTEIVQTRIEYYFTLIRAYYQSTMAINLGITNINALPDMAMLKRTLKIQTQNGRLGVAERSQFRKMLMQGYGLSDQFFKELDASLKSNCKKQNDAQSYLFLFQGFSNDLLVIISDQMRFKIALPNFFRKALYSVTAQTIHKILTKDNWKKDEVFSACRSVRKYKEKLGYSEAWMTEYVFPVLLISKSGKKKEPDFSKR